MRMYVYSGCMCMYVYGCWEGHVDPRTHCVHACMHMHLSATATQDARARAHTHTHTHTHTPISYGNSKKCRTGLLPNPRLLHLVPQRDPPSLSFSLLPSLPYSRPPYSLAGLRWCVRVLPCLLSLHSLLSDSSATVVEESHVTSCSQRARARESARKRDRGGERELARSDTLLLPAY